MTPDNFSPPADMPLHASEVYRYCSEIHITTSRAAQFNLHKSTKRLILYNFSLKDVTIDWAFFPPAMISNQHFQKGVKGILDLFP